VVKKPTNTTEVTFTLDGEDIILDVSPNWDVFALENDGEKILSSNVLGTSIFSHVDGDISKMFVESILSAVRTFQVRCNHNFRCDSHDERRWMSMIIEPMQHNYLKLTHTTIRTEPTTFKVHFDSVVKDRSKLIKRCSMCNKVCILTRSGGKPMIESRQKSWHPTQKTT
jgi:hypothetical protein